MSRLSDIKARLSKATPGPWTAANDGFHVEVLAVVDPMRVYDYSGSAMGEFICNLDNGEYNIYRDKGEMRANAKLIASAPADLAWLVARVEAMEKAILDAIEETVFIECKLSLADELDNVGMERIREHGASARRKLIAALRDLDAGKDKEPHRD